MNIDTFFLVWGQTLQFLWTVMTFGLYFLYVVFCKKWISVKVAYCVLMPVWLFGAMCLWSRIGTAWANSAKLTRIDMVGLFFSVVMIGSLVQTWLIILSFKAIAPKAWDRLMRRGRPDETMVNKS
jgi:hypothetical protein